MDMTSILLKSGANVDSLDSNGYSSCHLACKYGMIDHFNLLLYYRANVFSVDKMGKTPFDLACENGHEKMVECLLNCGLQKNLFQTLKDPHTAAALHLASTNGYVQIVSYLLKHGWDINQVTSIGSALHSAAIRGKTQVVKFLLKAGIDTTIKNSDGLTAYEWAKKKSYRNSITFKETLLLLKKFHSFFDAIAIEDYCGAKIKDLSLSKGDKVWIIDRSDKHVWKGIVFGPKGDSRTGFLEAAAVQKEAGIGKKDFHNMSSNDQRFQENDLQLPAVLTRSSSNISGTIHLQNIDIRVLPDANRNSPFRMSSFGEAKTIKNNDRSDSNMGMVSNAAMCNPVSRNANRESAMNSKMYASSFCLAPADVSLISSRSSQNSSGFESVKCSTSNSASSFPSVVQSKESGCESNQSVRSFGSGSDSSYSIVGREEVLCNKIQGFNVTAMVENGVPHAEILASWLESLNMAYYLPIFLKQGYDIQTIARCSPQDLLSLGIKNPYHRKTMIDDIHSWKITDQLPLCVPNDSLRDWLHSITLTEYIYLFEKQNYNKVVDVLDLTWEDFEDIGVKRLGHLKKFGLAIKKIKEYQRNTLSMSFYKQRKDKESPNYHSLEYEISRLNLRDPPPPAPFQAKSDVHNQFDSFNYIDAKKSTLSVDMMTSCYKEKMNCDPIFSDDEPIRLNLVQTGKILSDISKIRQLEPEKTDFNDLHKCPPPPASAPLSCGSRLLFSNSTLGEHLSDNIRQFPFSNDYCGETCRQVNFSNVPATLPPLLLDERSSDNSSYSSSTRPTVDEILKDLQCTMNNLISTSTQ